MREIIPLIIFCIIFNSSKSQIGFSSEVIWEKSLFPHQFLATVWDKTGKNYFYTGENNGGIKIYNVNNIESPQVIKSIPTSNFDSLNVMNLFQEGNYLYCALGNFFGTELQKTGFAIINVSDPANPVITDKWVSDSVMKGSGIVIAKDNYAYLGAMNRGLMIFDISDKSNIKFVSQLIPDKNFPLANPTPSQEPNARGMDIKGNYLYLCYDAGGIRVIDVSDKNKPLEISRYINAGVSNKQQAYNNLLIEDTIAFAPIDYCGMEILNIADPMNIKQIAWFNPWGCEKPTNLWLNSPGHTNQIVRRNDKWGKFVIMSAGASQLVTVDITDIENPKEPINMTPKIEKQGMWALDIKGDYIVSGYINSFVPFFSNWTGIKLYSILWTEVSVEESTNHSDWFNVYASELNKEISFFSNNEDGKGLSVEIYSIYGSTVYSSASGANNLKWNLTNSSGENISTGVYLYIAKSGYNTATGRIMVYRD